MDIWTPSNLPALDGRSFEAVDLTIALDITRFSAVAMASPDC
jgi:hypothetical protein